MIDFNMIQLANPKEPSEESNLTTYIIIVVGTVGVTAVQFILTSNITIHTLPLLRRVFINILMDKRFIFLI